MALDRTSLSATTSFSRRPAVLNNVQRAPEHSRSPARVLQERFGNRGTQMLVARSIARQPDAVAAHGVGAKSETSCSPGSCECTDCKDGKPKGAAGMGAFVAAGTLVAESSGAPQANAAVTRTAPKLPVATTNVLPFPSTPTPRQPEPSPQVVPPAASMEQPVSQVNELSSPAFTTKHDDGVGAASAKGQPAKTPAGPTTAPPARSAGGPGQVVQADTVRSQALVVAISLAMHQRVSGFFGDLRARFAAFFAQSSASVQQFIVNTQAQIAAVVAQTATSIQTLVARALNAAEQAANNVRQSIESLVQRVIASLQTQVNGIANQIIGVMNRFPLSDLPGISQLRAAATAVVRRAASAVTAGLNVVNGIIRAALAAGIAVIQTMLGVARRIADAVISHAASVVQRLLQVAFQMLGRIAAFISSTLQSAFNATILPILNRLETMIHQAITTATQHAISALRSNRDEYLATVGEGDESGEESGSDELAQDFLAVNKEIVQTFRERSATILGSIVQRVRSGVSQIMARVNQAIATARQLIANLGRQVVQALRQIVQAVSNFIQSVVQGFVSAVTKVVGYVRALFESPIDQLVRFARDILDRMIDFIARIARNLVNAITGSAPSAGTGFFSPVPTFAPSPAFAPTPLPVLIAIFAFIIALLGGTVYLVGGTIIIIIGGTVIYISVTAAIIIVVVIILIALLIMIYITYRIIRTRRRRKRPAKIIHLTKKKGPLNRTRLTIGVGEEVFLEYTHGATTWFTTGGNLSVKPPATSDKCTLDAPDTAGPITVTAGTASVTFQVVAPTGVFMERRGGIKHTKNLPDSGIRVAVFIQPDTVNFYRITYHEMDIAFTPTVPGVYSCNPFKTGHCKAGGGGVPCPDLVVLDTVVIGKGTTTKIDDCAYSGHCGSAHPHIPGNVSGNIPHEYKVLGPTGGGFHPFPPVLQIHTLEADAVTLTTRKAAASGTCKVTDNSSSIPGC